MLMARTDAEKFRDLEVFQSQDGNCMIDLQGEEDRRLVIRLPGAVADKLTDGLLAFGYGNKDAKDERQ
jgi:hypothetical protein